MQQSAFSRDMYFFRRSHPRDLPGPAPRPLLLNQLPNPGPTPHEPQMNIELIKEQVKLVGWTLLPAKSDISWPALIRAFGLPIPAPDWRKACASTSDLLKSRCTKIHNVGVRWILYSTNPH